MRYRLVPLTVLILLLPLSQACTYALGSYGLIDGRQYRRDQLAQLSRGMSEEQVHALLGQPSERRTKTNGSTWPQPVA
jgi:outer membrane protein assembly factor BamE (lipoprotein component of BamABCDE complex)